VGIHYGKKVGWTPPPHPGPPKPHLSPATGPYDFSPSTTAAIVALVASKADDGLFSVAYQQPTSLRFTGYATWQYATPGQLAPFGASPTIALLLAPVTPASARLYSWSLIYRQHRQGGNLCADQAQDSIARGLLAQAALQWMNSLDLYLGTLAIPTARPDVAGLALDPQGRIIGSLLGNVGPKIPTSG
jgi:hypothetical protein